MISRFVFILRGTQVCLASLWLSASLAANEVGVAALPKVQEALRWVEAKEPETLEEQIKICEIPAPTFAETKRGEYVVGQFKALGLQNIHSDSVGNIYGLRPGRSAGPLVILSAHLDTVFPEGTDTRVKREGTLLKAPGIADNSRGVALLLTIGRALEANALATDLPVLFVATVGEEGLGDLKGARQLFQTYPPAQVAHFIGLDGTGLGVTNGAVGSNRYRVTFQAAGGHSYGVFGLVNPIHALGRAIAKISQFEVPVSPKTTFNVGRIEGGTSVNTISQSAWLEMDMRSTSADELAKLDAAFQRAIQDAVSEENAFWLAQAKNPMARVTNSSTPLTVRVESVGQRPTGKVDENAPILASIRKANAALGIENKFDASSTDANIPISLGVSAVTLKSGGESRGNHAIHEEFDTKQSHLGTQRALLVLLELAGVVN